MSKGSFAPKLEGWEVGGLRTFAALREGEWSEPQQPRTIYDSHAARGLLVPMYDKAWIKEHERFLNYLSPYGRAQALIDRCPRRYRLSKRGRKMLQRWERAEAQRRIMAEFDE